MANTVDAQEDIAVIGLGLKFPGDASTPEAFYDLLLEGRSALQETPQNRYNIDAFYHPDHERFGAVSYPHCDTIWNHVSNQRSRSTSDMLII